MNVRNIDAWLTAIVEVADRSIHSFVSILANAAEHFDLHVNKALTVVVEIKIIGTKVVRTIEVGVPIAIQVAACDRKSEVGLRHAHVGQVHLFEMAWAHVMKKDGRSAVLCVVPTLVHEM